MPAARQAEFGALPGRIGLAAADLQAQPAGDVGDVVGLQRDQLGAAQRAGEAEQQQRRSRLPRAVRSQVAAAA